MAEAKPKDTDNPVKPEMRKHIKVSKCGNFVELRFRTQRFHKLTLCGGKSWEGYEPYEKTLDMTEAGSESVLDGFFVYSVPKKTKDSAGEQGDQSRKDYRQQVIDNFERRVDWFLGKVTMQKKSAPVDRVGTDAKEMFLGYIMGNMKDAKGKAFTVKTLPAAICKANSLAEVCAAAKAMGVPAKKIEEVLNTLKLIEEMKASAKGVSIAEVDAVAS